MKKLRKCKVLAVLMAVLLTLSMFTALNVSAVSDVQQISANQLQGEKLYFKPNSNWITGNVRFAVYLSGGTSGAVWVSMTDNDDGYYTANIPAGDYKKVNFCRMSATKVENTWGNLSNKTVAVDIPANGNNCFTLDSGLWNNATGSWSKYTVVSVEKLYFKPNSNWITGNVRFAVYLSGGTSSAVWVSMTDNGDGYYTANIPAGNYKKVNFCRMSATKLENTWGNLSNKTVAVDIPANGNNCFTLDNGLWNNATGSWSKYTVVSVEKLYFKPNSNWLTGNVRFAVYLSGGTSSAVWVSMTDNGDGYYTANIPAGDYKKVNFCRMSATKLENTWGNLSNKTVAVDIPANGNNCFTLDSGLWNNATGSWSKYTVVKTNTLYFKPNSNWLTGNVRFAVYLSGGTSSAVWVSMTDNGDGYYTADIPAGDYKKVNFCRMSATKEENTWGNLSNKTVAVDLPDNSNNCFTLDSGLWNNATGGWSEYTKVETKLLYFKPNKNWLTSTPRFAVYLSGGTSSAVWVSLTANNDGYYTAEIPAGDYKKVNFCRMNSSNAENSWGNLWNKSVAVDFSIDSKNCFTLDEGLWSSATGVWSVYSAEKPTNPTEPIPTEPTIVKYTVVFKDYDNTVLKTEEVESGKNATPPVSPTREGYKFIGWDKSFDNVTGNLTVTAKYEQVIIKYTVVFKDYDNTVLKTEEVESGKNATPPASPTREGYKFIGWDKSFDNVTGNLTVTAKYEQELTKYTVTFVDYNGKQLSKQSVAEGGSANLPANPTKAGVTFLGWSGNYVNITKDETVRAVYSDEKNVFVIESVTGNVNDTVTVLVSIDGKVKTCGFDFTLLYDPALELASIDDDLDLDIIANTKAIENGIVLNFSSPTDKTKQRDIIELTFNIKDATKTELPITLNVRSFKEVSGFNIINADYQVVNGVVKVQ